MNYREALEYVDSLKKYGVVPGLDTIRELCRRLGNPQDKLAFVHIAGTNGKGSTLSFVSTVLQCAGYRVGRYISPTIFQYCERIQVNQRPISQACLGRLFDQVKAACEDMASEGFSHPTAFEAETALAFCYFLEKKCDIVVLEAGMGGEQDSTNLITNTKVAVLSSISMDHMQFLGDTLEQIARQKAGIIKPGCRVVTLRQDPAAEAVIAGKAKQCGCSVLTADPAEAAHIRYGWKRQSFDIDSYRKLTISLAGRYQIENAVLAVRVIEALSDAGFPVTETALRKGLLTARWPGRFQVISEKPLFVIDGAHNEDAARKLADSIEFYFTNKRIVYIMGMLRDKEYERVIAITHKYADPIITVATPDNPRALSAYELATAVSRVHGNVTAAASLEEAVEMAYLLAGKEDVILAFGSLSFLGRLTEAVKERKDYGRSQKGAGSGQDASGGHR